MFKVKRKVMAALLAVTMLSTASITVFAGVTDAWTEANQTQPAKDGKWDQWGTTWETIKNNPVQMSLSVGKNATEVNFSWYSKDTEAAPKLKMGKNQDLSDAKELTVTTTPAVSGYKSNKASGTNLLENTTYYYSYQVDGKWTNATVYKTQSTKSFSFLYVGDPQIGSSSANTATGATEVQGQDAAVKNDSFNWNNTLNTALKAHPNVSFLLSAGDQIQSSDAKDAASTITEIEYAGFLSPEALKSLPVATSIGNHDSPSNNYSFHFNDPNASKLGLTPAGGDYYYTYGNALFIMLNTNNTNMAEHQKLIEQAISENPNVKWRIATIHQDIYGSGEHSNEPAIVNLRYQLIPVLEKNDIDVVLTGHDHTYSRSLILKGGQQDTSKAIAKADFDNYVAGKTAIDSKYNDYLSSIEDPKAVQNVTLKSGSVVDPNGILYMTANSGSGSKYYELVPHQQAYIAARWQENTPTYSDIDIDDASLTINTYRTDTGEKIDNTYSIIKTVSTSKLKPVATNTSSNSTTGIGNVKTGDNFNGLPVVLLVLALAGVAYLNKNRIIKLFNR